MRKVIGNRYGSVVSDEKRPPSFNPPTDAQANPIDWGQPEAPESWRNGASAVWTIEAATQTMPRRNGLGVDGELYTEDCRRGNLKGLNKRARTARLFHPFKQPRAGNALPVDISANAVRSSQGSA